MPLTQGPHGATSSLWAARRPAPQQHGPHPSKACRPPTRRYAMRRFLFPAAAAAFVLSLTVLGAVQADPPIGTLPPPTHKVVDLSVTLPNAIKFTDASCKKVFVTVTNVGNAPSVPA